MKNLNPIPIVEAPLTEKPQLVELFYASDNLVIAKMSNWNGKGIRIPRIEVPACTREDLTSAGVYFLICKEDDDSDSVYIGEAENIKERLMQHWRDYQSGKEHYYWNTAVAFIGNDLNKASIRFLENRLVEITKACNRYKVLTKNTYKHTVLKESHIAAMEEFIENLRNLLNTLHFEKILEPLASDSGKDDDTFYISGKAAKGSGVVTEEGVVLYKEAQISDAESATISGSVSKLRAKRIAEGKVKDWVTTEDLLFNSPSAAAGFVLGYAVSGPASWKRKDGKSLKEIEEGM